MDKKQQSQRGILMKNTAESIPYISRFLAVIG